MATLRLNMYSGVNKLTFYLCVSVSHTPSCSCPLPLSVCRLVLRCQLIMEAEAEAESIRVSAAVFSRLWFCLTLCCFVLFLYDVISSAWHQPSSICIMRTLVWFDLVWFDLILKAEIEASKYNVVIFSCVTHHHKLNSHHEWLTHIRTYTCTESFYNFLLQFDKKPLDL